jgi:hypothetical protein
MEPQKNMKPISVCKFLPDLYIVNLSKLKKKYVQYYVIINKCFQPLNSYWPFGITCFLVAEKILVPISVTCVIRLSLFVLRHNYLCMCSLWRNLCSSGRNMDSWRWIMVGTTSAT